MNQPRRGARHREQVREATLNEIKQTALRLIREHGTAAVRFTDIARAMGMTAPALYWYFPDRNALFNALIADAGMAIGHRVARALESVAADDLFGQWQAVAQAYRQWARDEPQQFVLIREQRALVPPESAPATPADAAGGLTTNAADRTLSQMSGAFTSAYRAGKLAPPLIREVRAGLAGCARATSQRLDIDLPVESFQAMLHAWAALHGFISLEAGGHLTWLTEQARDDLFEAQVRLCALAAGLPT